MKLILIDETASNRDKDFYSICAVLIDHTKYPRISESFSEKIKNNGWTEGVEFKGNHIFSSSKGDKEVPIDTRIELAKDLLEVNVSNQNARLKAVFAWNKEGDTKENHLYLIGDALNKLMPGNPQKKDGKNLCIVFTDHNSKVSSSEKLRNCVSEALEKRNYSLVKGEVVELQSSYHHVGLCYADLLAYLCQWTCTTKNVREAQMSLFEEARISSNDEKKAETTREMLEIVKDIKIVSCT